ncbi:hypothetical protein F4821DRAFT_230968 [Hypoxylon rubiginosum]|uniref:Uncharacterized protein n=1 Tax=Hypoxylon rubiginosum TaxID=110542 RepID=A0ACC0DAR0_9PEZI|nr:hypothetical protein F4821DRAFT_230968 [Hypoxylon rubiginosum]
MKFRENSEDDIAYDPLSDEKSLLEHAEGELMHRKKRWDLRTTIAYGSILVSLLISVVLNIVAWRELAEYRQLPHHHPLDDLDSPIVRDIGIHYHTQFINGSFEKKNIYRQKASQEVDDAWLALGTNDGSIVIPLEDAAQYGIQEGQVQRVSEEGGGYMADIFVFHHLHCLNLMRQTSHWSWDYYRAKAYTDEAMGTAFENYTSEEQLETHFTHCLDIIRQEIMCTANTGIYGQWFVKDVGLVMDFSFNRQCKNFDAIREWYANNHVDMDNTYVRKRPGDVVFDEPL